MKLFWNIILPVILFVLLQACGNAERADRDEVGTTINDSLNDSTSRAHALTADVDFTGDEKTFIISAAAAGLMEVETATLVLKKSKDKLIQAFAAQLLKDHSLANKELNTIANAKGMQLPQTLSKDMTAHLKSLNVMADHAFNLQYLRMMINDHETSIQLFNEGGRLANKELKGFALKTLPVLQQHHDKAVALGKSFNISNINRGDDVLGISPGPKQEIK